MDTINKYKQYRKSGVQLNNKIIENADNKFIGKAAELLGILEEDTIVFEEEYEQDVLMDFLINERINEDKSLAETYLQLHGGNNRIEEDILNALVSSYTSLFKIKAIIEDDKTVILEDLLKDTERIKLIDISLSETATPEMLLFIRIVPFEHFNMTSGISFTFPAGRTEYLLRYFRRIMRRLKLQREEIARFVALFELNRAEGLFVRYHHIR